MPFQENTTAEEVIEFIHTWIDQFNEGKMSPENFFEYIKIGNFIAELATLPKALRGNVDVAKAAVSVDAGTLRLFDHTVRSNESVITEALSTRHMDNYILFLDDKGFRDQCIVVACAADSIRNKVEFSNMAIEHMLCLIEKMANLDPNHTLKDSVVDLNRINTVEAFKANLDPICRCSIAKNYSDDLQLYYDAFKLLRRCSMDVRGNHQVLLQMSKVFRTPFVLAYATNNQFNNKSLFEHMLQESIGEYEDIADLISVCGSEIKKDKYLINQFVDAKRFSIIGCVDPSLLEESYLLSLIEKNPALVRTLPYYLQKQHRYTLSMLQDRYSDPNKYNEGLMYLDEFTFNYIPDCFKNKNNQLIDRLIGFTLLKTTGLVSLSCMDESLASDPLIACYSIRLYGSRAYQARPYTLGVKFFGANKSQSDVLESLYNKEGDEFCNEQNLGKDGYLKLGEIQRFLKTVSAADHLKKLFNGIDGAALLLSLRPFLTAADLCRLSMVSKVSKFNQEDTDATSSPTLP